MEEASEGTAAGKAGKVDPIEWSRRRWRDADQPEPGHFAAMSAALRISQRLGASLDRLQREYELSRTGYLMMSTLLLTSTNSLPMSGLSRNRLLPQPTISFAMNQLEKGGLVARRPHPSDRRTTLTVLTSKGSDTIQRVNTSLGNCYYGLDGVTDRLAIALTEAIRQVSEELDEQS